MYIAFLHLFKPWVHAHNWIKEKNNIAAHFRGGCEAGGHKIHLRFPKAQSYSPNIVVVKISGLIVEQVSDSDQVCSAQLPPAYFDS
jgi:hypothetical protein